MARFIALNERVTYHVQLGTTREKVIRSYFCVWNGF